MTKLSDFTEGYITGSFKCYEIDGEGIATGSLTEMGYGILVDSSEYTDSYWPMDIYTFNLSSNLFDFPTGLLSSNSNYVSSCGPAFFPDSIRTRYKIKFQYRILKNDEKEQFACGPCPDFSSFSFGKLRSDNNK